MALLTMLLSLLFSVYREQKLSSLEMDRIVPKQLVKNLVDEKLASLFIAVEKGSFGLIKDVGLYFSFIAPLSQDKDFSGKREGLLALNKEGELYFLTLPKKESRKPRAELLMEGISGIDYSFFSIKEKKWMSSWSIDSDELPAFCKVRLFKGEELVFDRAYLFPQAQQEITYSARVL